MPRCAKCGFLCLRNLDTRNLDEVEEEIRNTGGSGALSSRQDRQGNPLYLLRPICFVQAYSLPEEHGKFLDVINKDRECAKFETWQQGLSPKEHLEMLQAKEMLAWQAEERVKERTWQDEQKKTDFERQQLQRKSDRRFQILVVVFAALVSAVVSWLTTHFMGK